MTQNDATSEESTSGIDNSNTRSGSDLVNALVTSEEQFRLLVESVTEYGIFLLDTAGHIATWNKGAEQIEGYRAEEVIGKHFSIFYTEEDIARQHPQHELETALADGRFEEEGWRVRKDGTQFLANVVIQPLYDAHGVHQGYTKVTRDITKRKLAEEDRLQMVRDHVSRVFLREILYSVTEGKLRFCNDLTDLPAPLPESSHDLPFSRNSLAAIRRLVREFTASAAFPEERVADLLTAVGEATMNAAVHAQDAHCQVCISPGGSMQVWVRDHGTGIDIANVHRATLERGFTTRGTLGHGFWLILHTVDRVWLLTGPEGTIIVLEQDRTPTEPHWLSTNEPDSETRTADLHTSH